MNLLILGEGPERTNLENLIADSGLEGRIFLPGRLDNPMPYFKHAEMCIVSSIQEGFPNVLLEMMSQNRHVVSTIYTEEISNIGGLVGKILLQKSYTNRL